MSSVLITRRTLLGLMLALPGAGVARAAAFDVAALQGDDMALGNPAAQVTVIEYASAGCPHCANWANDVFPAFKARFIDTGKARFVLREVITGQPTIATAGFMLARCAPAGRYFDVIDGVFARQADIFAGKVSPADALEAVAASIGMSDDAFKACLTDQANLDAVNARSQRHATQDGVDTTPAFFVGARRLDGEQTLDQLAAAIAAAGKSHGRR